MNKSVLFAFLLAFTILFDSCTPKSRLSKLSKDTNLDIVDFKYFSTKMKINYQDDQQQIDLTASVRMKKDEKVWIALLGPFGIKVGKALITTDSIQVLRDFQAKEYYAYSMEELNAKQNTNLSLSQVQNLILGNPISSAKPKISKDSTTIVLEQEEALFKILSKIMNGKINHVNISHQKEPGIIDIQYDEYDEVDKKTIPTKLAITVEHPQKNLTTKLQLKNSSFTTEKLSFPINVSSKYVRK